MRSAIASRAVSIRTGTRSPAARSAPADLEPVDAGQADVEHDRVRAAVAASASASSPSAAEHRVIAGERERAPQRVPQRPVVVDDQDLHRRPIVTAGVRFFGSSYLALTLLLHGRRDARRHENSKEGDSTRTRRRGGPGLGGLRHRQRRRRRLGDGRTRDNDSKRRSASFRRRSSTGFDDLAEKLGVDAGRARARPCSDFHEQETASAATTSRTRSRRRSASRSTRYTAAFDGSSRPQGPLRRAARQRARRRGRRRRRPRSISSGRAARQPGRLHRGARRRARRRRGQGRGRARGAAPAARRVRPATTAARRCASSRRHST